VGAQIGIKKLVVRLASNKARKPVFVELAQRRPLAIFIVPDW
jgi:hypothetical protein